MSKHNDLHIYSTELINEMMTYMDDAEIAAAIDSTVEEAEHGPDVVDPQRWYRVSWPEHVITPRYNSDATYHPTDEAPTSEFGVYAGSCRRI